MKEYTTWHDFEKAIDKMVRHYKDTNENCSGVYGIPRGGAIPGVWLSHKLGIKYQQINSSQISKTADLSHILIVDDICDSGETIKKIKENFPKCQTATLYYKKTAIDTPDIYGETVGEEWLVFPWESNEEIGNRDKTYE